MNLNNFLFCLSVILEFEMELEVGESPKVWDEDRGWWINGGGGPTKSASQATYNGVSHRTCNNGRVCHKFILFNCLIFKLCSRNENSFDRQIRDLYSLFW